MSRLAVVLFNLGGPDGPDAVRPFLFNLFNDPAIIGAPGPIRWALAQLISRRRAPVAREIYHHLGGASPILGNTQDQAKSLESILTGNREARVFIAMRYWHPFAAETAREVMAYAPDEIVLLPLYPQFSTATTQSSFDDWDRAAAAAGLAVRTHRLCCYPIENGWISALATQTKAALTGTSELKRRYLFSAHGLPRKIVDGGDPYQWQVEQTAAALANALGLAAGDWTVCYQSRVGPLEWIGPSLEDEIKRAAADGVAVAVVPVAFVSEHSETLVELDIEYRKLADTLRIPSYVRVPTVDVETAFIEGLASMVERVLSRSVGLSSADGPRICPGGWRRCPCAA